MIEFLRVQYRLGNVSKEQLLTLVHYEQITIDEYNAIVGEEK